MEPKSKNKLPDKKGAFENNLSYLLDSSKTRPIFVIGTERSSTHWLGHSLKDHPEIRATMEAQPMFDLSLRMALNPELEVSLLPQLVQAYKRQLLESAPLLYLDTSHPNIWIAERLKGAFPEAQFIGIQRNAYPAVVSMLKHQDIATWQARWREFSAPSPFLGITPELVQTYETLPLPAQCALRWCAHQERMAQLERRLKNDLLVISFEGFVNQTDRVLAQINSFLGLKTPFAHQEMNTEMLYEWESQLSAEALQQIEQVVGFGPDA